MPHLVHDPIEPFPREGLGSVERRISVRFRGTVATAEVLAGWGRMEVRIVEPEALAEIAKSFGSEGLTGAMGAQIDPSRLFVYGGELSARALRLAQQFIVRVLANHEFVERHAVEIAHRCITARQRTERIETQIRQLENTGERAALRRAFKRGELTQKAYQSIMREMGKNRALRQFDLERVARKEVGHVARGLWRSRIPLEHALIHLRHPQVFAGLPEDLQLQVASG